MTSNYSKLTHYKIGKLLVRAYPQALSGSDGEYIYFHDGSSMSIAKNPGQARLGVDLEDPGLLDQFASEYPFGDHYVFGQPQQDDPGRTRNMPFFKKMYGSSQAEVENNLVEIQWMPRSRDKTVRFTRVNGADQQLVKVSRELDQLPHAQRNFCTKIGGTYFWRNIAGTDQLSPHAFGIAIDINVAYGDYWKWDHKKYGETNFRNRVPKEIVEIFERHGFIWGGKWKHYDSMHFEYRPELIMDANPDYSKIKVLFLGRQPNSYGSERQLCSLAEGLPKARFIPIVAYAETGAEKTSTSSINGVDRVHLRMRPWRKICNVFSRYFDAFSLLRLSRDKNIQLVHCSYQWLLPYALFVAFRMRIPLVTHIRRPNNGLKKLRFLGCHRCDAVIAISNRIRRELLKIDELEGKVHLITDAVNLSSFEGVPDNKLRSELDADGKVLFGLVARIYRSKRQLDFVKAAKLLLDKDYDAHFVLVGRIDDDSYSRKLKSYLISNNLTDRIHMLGHHDEVTRILSSIDVLVSLAGGSVMYEAMAAGKTVISAGFTRPEDSTHLINGLTGLVTESKDINILASLMERTITEPELRSALGKSAQDYAKSTFSVTAMVDATEKVYDRLLNSQA